MNQASDASRRDGAEAPPEWHERCTNRSAMTQRARSGSPRMFESDLFERFSRAHPLAPAILYLPVAALGIVLSWPHGALRTALSVFAGYLVWTVVEYWLHRLVFHLPVVGPKSARVAFVLHGVHHESPSDETRLVMPIGASLPMGLFIFFAFRLVLGADGAWGPFAGFAIGYVIYDEVHWYLHAGKPTSAWARWLRRQHFLHHFSEPTSRFGVSCPWLDYVFLSRGSQRKSSAAAAPANDHSSPQSNARRSA